VGILTARPPIALILLTFVVAPPRVAQAAIAIDRPRDSSIEPDPI
jgi:hypothetical protein